MRVRSLTATNYCLQTTHKTVRVTIGPDPAITELRTRTRLHLFSHGAYFLHARAQLGLDNYS